MCLISEREVKYDDSKKNIKKSAVLLVSLALLLMVTAGATLAYYFTKDDPITNTFTPSQVACAVVEGTNAPVDGATVNTGKTKEDVKIKNTGDTDAYIRVALVVNWMKQDGTVWAAKPVLGTDYEMVLDLSNGWSQGADGYYYYSAAVAKDNMTGALITSASQLQDAPEGYQLSIEIVAEAIQAEGIDASYTAQQAWQLAAKAN